MSSDSAVLAHEARSSMHRTETRVMTKKLFLICFSFCQKKNQASKRQLSRKIKTAPTKNAARGIEPEARTINMFWKTTSIRESLPQPRPIGKPPAHHKSRRQRIDSKARKRKPKASHRSRQSRKAEPRISPRCFPVNLNSPR